MLKHIFERVYMMIVSYLDEDLLIVRDPFGMHIFLYLYVYGYGHSYV
jgi:hypothetical protein